MVGVMLCPRACGARPSETWAFQGRMAFRGKAKSGAQGAVFSEGCTLCIRKDGPYASRGMSLPPGVGDGSVAERR